MINYFCVPVNETKIYGKVYLFDYAARNESECIRKIMQVAWDNDKFNGSYQERLDDLGWKIVKMKIEELI